MTKRPRPEYDGKPGYYEGSPPRYHRRQLGGGNALKAVTRARRSAPSRLICRVENVRPAVWRADLRRQREALQRISDVIEAVEQEQEAA